MRIYIFRILTMIHFLSSLSPFARKQRDRMGQRADLTKGSLVDGHHPRRNARLSNAPPGPGNNRRKFVKGGTHACARGGLFISAAGELAATALSLSDVTNVAFNATSQVSYYYSPWQPSQPFHPQPRPIGTKRPFDRVHMASRPQRAFLPLSLSLTFFAPFLHRSVDTLVYSFSEPRSGRQVSVIVSRVAGRERRKRRNVSQARLCVDRGLGGSLLVFDEIHRPKDGPHCFISHESVTPRSPRGRKIRQ